MEARDRCGSVHSLNHNKRNPLDLLCNYGGPGGSEVEERSRKMIEISNIPKVFLELLRTNGSQDNADRNFHASIIFSTGPPGLGFFGGAFL
jgi:hypothetical protein